MEAYCVISVLNLLEITSYNNKSFTRQFREVLLAHLDEELMH